MLKWVANRADRKPDFDLDDAKPGQVVTLQLPPNGASRWRPTSVNSADVVPPVEGLPLP
jgi:hypothetical protein